ncbi:hypothetical protein C1H46_032743 [Malus baccata]|uniref:Uncharacterized protein n=1 Tax=Malus baccata TaxID=106549 RepID=A0A540L5D3_MALBA|nr:hypothetical protein C1H46_032743 [Malus baccata]
MNTEKKIGASATSAILAPPAACNNPAKSQPKIESYNGLGETRPHSWQKEILETMLHIVPNLPMLEEVLLSGQLRVMPILLRFEFNTTLRVSILMKIHRHRHPQADEEEASGEKSLQKN